MHTLKLRRVTIVAEAVIASRIQEEVISCGASGYTVTDADGKGSRGVRASEWEGKNRKIETLVRSEVADRILEVLAARYFPHFAVIAYAHDVEVVRGDKYT